MLNVITESHFTSQGVEEASFRFQNFDIPLFFLFFFIYQEHSLNYRFAAIKKLNSNQLSNLVNKPSFIIFSSMLNRYKQKTKQVNTFCKFTESFCFIMIFNAALSISDDIFKL